MPIPSACIPCEIRFALSRPLRFTKGRISPPLPVIPADAGIQGHKNNRLPRAALVGPVRLRGSGVVCFSLGSRVRGKNDVVAAGTVSRGPGIQGHKNNRLPAPLWLARSACAGAACFVLLWVPASAGMTWLSRE